MDKFGDFSCDINYNFRPGVFRDVISLLRTQNFRQPRSANKRTAIVYLYIPVYFDSLPLY